MAIWECAEEAELAGECWGCDQDVSWEKAWCCGEEEVE